MKIFFKENITKKNRLLCKQTQPTNTLIWVIMQLSQSVLASTGLYYLYKHSRSILSNLRPYNFSLQIFLLQAIIFSCTSLIFSSYLKVASIENVSSTKWLGVMISNDLKWNVHAEMICKKFGTRLCFLRQLKRTKVSTKDLLASTPLVYAQL